MRQQTELNAFRELINKAERWQKCQAVRQYIAASKFRDETWIAWVNKKLDWFDPNIEADEEWLNEINRDQV